MIKRVLGGLFAIAVIGVVVWSAIGYGSYSSMLPIPAPHEEPCTVKCDTIACDSISYDAPQNLTPQELQ